VKRIIIFSTLFFDTLIASFSTLLFQIWKQDNQSKLCADPKLTKQKITYILTNPVALGLVEELEHYRLSSVRRMLVLTMSDHSRDYRYGAEEEYVMT